MKLKNLKMMVVTLVIATTIMVGCKKEAIKTQEAVIEATSDYVALEETADNLFANSEAQGGDEATAFFFENDGLPTEYSLESSEVETLNESEEVKRNFNQSQIISCLRKVKPNDEQVGKLKRALNAYNECKESIIKRYKNSLREIVESHNKKLEGYKEALRNERITKEQFEKLVKELRKSLNDAKNELAMKARKAIKECYGKLLRQINSILTERQWKAFAGCLRR